MAVQSYDYMTVHSLIIMIMDVQSYDYHEYGGQKYEYHDCTEV